MNYANDYSDGIRGTDEVRVGPVRLVASGLATPRQVLAAALACFAVAGAAGLVLAAVTSWWLLLRRRGRGRGGLVLHRRPPALRVPGTGRGLGVPVLRPGRGGRHRLRADAAGWPGCAVAAAAPVGLLACALLVINNLRDIPTDSADRQADARGRARRPPHPAAVRRPASLLPFCVAAALRRGGAAAPDRAGGAAVRARPRSGWFARAPPGRGLIVGAGPDRAAAARLRRPADAGPGHPAVTVRLPPASAGPGFSTGPTEVYATGEQSWYATQQKIRW